MLTEFTFCIPLKSKCTGDMIKAYIDHICCPSGPSKKILTDNGTEFKNKLWTEVFDKLKTEHKFTPIYSLQCSGRIEGFHKFLKATIVKQLQTSIEWDDLVWKATAAYNLFPTESSGMASFFLMFGCEAAVKHTLLQSENPKYLGTDDGMINVELMTKPYMIVAHNLNEARKARDGNKKGSMTTEPEKLKIGDNVLVRDHTSKAFQPKYKDFCIIGLLGKNQLKVKDNHGHTTKVHCRDVKKIPMTEKVCQLYEEEQIGKVREGRKMVPSNKMPELGWDIAETQLYKEGEQAEYQESTQTSQQTPCPLQAIIAIAIIITTIMENIKTYIQEIPAVKRKTMQASKFVTTKINHSKLMQNIRESYRTAMLAITIATRMTNRTSRISQQQTNNRKKQNTPGTQKLSDQHDGLYQSHMSGSKVIVTTIKTSCKSVSDVLRKDRTEHGNTRTQNSK